MFEENKKRNKLLQGRNITFFVAIIAIVIIYHFFSGAGTQVTLQFDEDRMALAHPTDSSVSMEIMYQDILSVNDVSEFDVGQKVSAGDDDEILFTIWENEDYGQYTLCASPKSSHYIVLNTVNGVVVFNCGDAATSQELCKAINKLLQERKSPA